MRLMEILEYYGFYEVLGEIDLGMDIKGITSNSKEVGEGYIFVGIDGGRYRGLDFYDEAVERGASLVVVSRGVRGDFSGDRVVLVDNARRFLSRVVFYMNRGLMPKSILSVSGTNGKSSVSFFVSQFLGYLGVRSMVVGTLGIYIDGKKELECLTTPDANTLCKYFGIAKERGIDYVVMESSSHGIEQHRIDGIDFRAVGFTNLTQDHLDYHGSMEGYFEAKARLYVELLKNTAVINVDDKWGMELRDRCRGVGVEVMEYGVKAKMGGRNLVIEGIKSVDTIQGVVLNYESKTYGFEVGLMGEFQVYNIVCAMGILLSCGFKIDDLLGVVREIKEVEGRFNYIRVDNNKLGIKGKIFIDFAHTPNALEEVLKVLRKETKGRLKVVFGCGGNRDSLKRPIMGEIAGRYADCVYITDDNPRFEEPNEIRKEIEAGIKTRKNLEVFNIDARERAIKQAVLSLKEEDILLIAGKGHENYQIIKDDVIAFSDKEVVLGVLAGDK